MQNTEPDQQSPGRTNVIHVAVGVIWNPEKTAVLIARRPSHVHQGGLWEFPGGKVETGETVTHALARELLEELAIEAGAVAPALEIHHSYPGKTVLLDVWQVENFVGVPRGCEGQSLAWVLIDQLDNYAFPEANRAIIDYLNSCSLG
jgi:8-oxo-dGTP diphosphatase